MEIDKIALIYLKDKKILGTLSYGKTNFYLPGGKRQESETDKETLIRECKEELNVDIKEDTIKYYGTFKALADLKDVLVKMTCYTASFDGNPIPSSEISEIKWLTFKDLDKVSLVDTIIFKDLKEKGLLE